MSKPISGPASAASRQACDGGEALDPGHLLKDAKEQAALLLSRLEKLCGRGPDTPFELLLNKMRRVLALFQDRNANSADVLFIFQDGPVAQAIGMRPGDMCRITRPSKTSIQTLFYRICSA